MTRYRIDGMDLAKARMEWQHELADVPPPTPAEVAAKIEMEARDYRRGLELLAREGGAPGRLAAGILRESR